MSMKRKIRSYRAFNGSVERGLDGQFVGDVVNVLGNKEYDLIVFDSGWVDLYIVGNTQKGVDVAEVVVKLNMGDESVWCAENDEGELVPRVNVNGLRDIRDDDVREVVREAVSLGLTDKIVREFVEEQERIELAEYEEEQAREELEELGLEPVE